MKHLRHALSPRSGGLRPSGYRYGLLACLVIASAAGCSGMRTFAFRKNDGPFGAGTPCTLSKTPTVEEVVAHVNRNVEKIDGWRASSVRIRAQSVPIPLSGNLVVERDQRLRLEVTSVAGKEVDLGSNEELFWLWMRPRGQQPPAVYYAAHEDMDVARQQLPVPFEPTWLMEALGVTPLSAENVHLDGEAGVAAIKLVSEHQMPDGQTVKKVVVVHACHGYVIEHSTYDHRGQPLVRALLQDYRLDPESGAVLPRHVKLDWPQAEMSLAMDLGHVEVNPTSIPAAVWKMPQVPGSALVDLGNPRMGGEQQYATRPRPSMQPSEDRVAVAAGTAAKSHSARPTVLASSADQLDPFLPPTTPPRSQGPVSSAADFPDDDFQPPKVQWQTPPASSDFMPPLEPPPDANWGTDAKPAADVTPATAAPTTTTQPGPFPEEEPAGRAQVDLLPELEPF